MMRRKVETGTSNNRRISKRNKSAKWIKKRSQIKTSKTTTLMASMLRRRVLKRRQNRPSRRTASRRSCRLEVSWA